MKHFYIVGIATLLLMTKANAQTTITANKANKYVGQIVTICDKIYGAKYLEKVGITLLNVGGNYPNQYLTLVIRGNDRAKFKTKPEVELVDKNICVTGKIIDYKGAPEILVNDVKQIVVEDKQH